jgi:hypothetical protein
MKKSNKIFSLLINTGVLSVQDYKRRDLQEGELKWAASRSGFIA